MINANSTRCVQLVHNSLSSIRNTGTPDVLARTTSNLTSLTFKFDNILAYLTRVVGDLGKCTGTASTQLESGCEI